MEATGAYGTSLIYQAMEEADPAKPGTGVLQRLPDIPGRSEGLPYLSDAEQMRE